MKYGEVGFVLKENIHSLVIGSESIQRGYYAFGKKFPGVLYG